MHGGAAPQVAARREQRVLEGRAALAGGVVEERDVTDSLLAAAADSDALLQRLRRQVKAGEPVDATLLTSLGDWLDRTARLSKLVIDARLDERRLRLREGELALLAAGLAWFMHAQGLTGDPVAEERLTLLLEHLDRGSAPDLDWRPPLSLGPGQLVAVPE